MNRRTLVVRVSAVLATGGLAGCADSTVLASAENRRSDGETMDDNERNDGTEPTHTEDTEPYERRQIGDADLPEGVEPHEIHVRNAADEGRAISVRIDRDGEPVFDRTGPIPAGGYIEVVLVEPAAYAAVIEADGAVSKTTIDRSWSDCSRSRTTVTIRSNGIETRSRSVRSTCD